MNDQKTFSYEKNMQQTGEQRKTREKEQESPPYAEKVNSFYGNKEVMNKTCHIIIFFHIFSIFFNEFVSINYIFNLFRFLSTL